MAHWALVLDGVVDNVIVATETVADTYLKPGGDYDNVIDLTDRDPQPGPGWLYNAGNNTFSSPPVDYVQLLRQSYSDLHAQLSALLENAAQLDSDGQTEAFNQALSDLAGDFTDNEETLFDAVASYVTGGG